MNEHKTDEQTVRSEKDNAVNDSEKAKSPDIDVDALTDEEAKSMLKSLIEEAGSLKAQNAELESQLAEAKQEAATNKDSWYRCAAEFENFKKRNAETRLSAYYDGKKDAILSLLIVGDSVDRALSVELDDKTREGVMLIKRQFEETLSALSVEEIDPVGQTFDPTVAEAIATVSAAEGEKAGVVKTVYKKGYKLSGKMLRYAQVIVTQ
ncbi:MAG: nucleotide exchange factor GrpE [Clostridia bacterium]|nr:nucleotide exchange factor GrpE [Clostridia bacterium]